MKKLLIILLLSFVFNLYSNESINNIDALDYEGKYEEALNLLIDLYDEDNPDLLISWRIARETALISENINDKKEKIKNYELAIKITKPLLDSTSGTSRDRAELIHWYTVNYASKIKLLGIFAGRESLKIVPEVFRLLEKCIKTDPTYGGAYFFRARFYEDIPFFLGGDKFKMELEYKKALKYANVKEKMTFLLFATKSFLKRDWSTRKKEDMIKKNNQQQNFNTIISDKEQSLKFLEEAISFFKILSYPTYVDKLRYKECLQLLEE